MILRQRALGAQRSGDRNRPALGDVAQARRRVIVLNPGANQERDGERGAPLSAKCASAFSAASRLSGII